MEHTTPTDLAALEAEVAALEAEGAAQDARIDALLTPRTPAPTIRQRMDALWAALAQGGGELDVIEREQSDLADAIDALEGAE